MYKCVNVDSLNDEFIAKKNSINNLNIKETNGRTVKSNYSKNDVEHMVQNVEKDYLDRFDMQKGNLNNNYLYFCDNLIDEDSSKNSDVNSKTIDEHLKNYSYNVNPEYAINNKFINSEKRVNDHILSLNEHKSRILSNECINNNNINKNDGNKNSDIIVNMISNHYNNLIRTTNKGIENINSNCDAIISKQNYDSISDVSSTILVNKNDIIAHNNNDYSDYNYNSYFNYLNDYISAHHYNSTVNNSGQNNGSNSSHNYRCINGSNRRITQSRNCNYDSEKRECFPFVHESSLSENLIHDNCDYIKTESIDMPLRENELNSLSAQNDQEVENKNFQEMDEQAKNGNIHFGERLQLIERDTTSNRIKIYDIFNNLNVKKSNNTNIGILNFLKNKKKHKYLYDSKGIRNENTENGNINKDSHSRLSNIASGNVRSEYTEYGNNAEHTKPSDHNHNESNNHNSNDNYSFSMNMRNNEGNNYYNSSHVLKGSLSNKEDLKNKILLDHHNLNEMKYIEKKEHELFKEELANKYNTSSHETLKLLEKDDNGNVNNIYKSALNEYLKKKETISDEFNKDSSVKILQKNPFSFYHYVKENPDNVSQMPCHKGKHGSSKSSCIDNKGNDKVKRNSGINRIDDNHDYNQRYLNHESVIRNGSNESVLRSDSHKSLLRNENHKSLLRNDNHDNSNGYPCVNPANKKSPMPSNAAPNINDRSKIDKRGADIFKTTLQKQNNNFNHNTKKSIKTDSFNKKQKMDGKEIMLEKDENYCKKGVDSDKESQFNTKWNGHVTYLHEENKKNEKMKTNEELSSKYISSYSKSSEGSSIKCFSESKNRVTRNIRKCKIVRDKEIKSAIEKKYNIKRKINIKEKQENEQFHPSGSNSLIDCMSCIYEDSKNYNFVDRIIHNHGNQKNASPYNASVHNSNRSKICTNNKAVDINAIIRINKDRYSESEILIGQNNCKCELGNTSMLYVMNKKKNKKKKKKKKIININKNKKDSGSEPYNESDSNNAERNYYKYKNDIKPEDKFLKSKHRRRTSCSDNCRNCKDIVESNNRKYPNECNTLKKGNYNNSDNDDVGDDENERDNSYYDTDENHVASNVIRSKNPYNLDVASDSNEMDSDSNEDNDYDKYDRCAYYDKRSSCDKHCGCHIHPNNERYCKNDNCINYSRDKSENRENSEKWKNSQKYNDNIIVKNKKKRKSNKEELLKAEERNAQDQVHSSDNEMNILDKSKIKKKSNYIISNHEQCVCSIQADETSNKDDFINTCKNVCYDKGNNSKKFFLKKRENHNASSSSSSSSSFNPSTNEKYKDYEIQYNNSVPNKSFHMKEEEIQEMNSIKKTHRRSQCINLIGIRNIKETNTNNSRNNQSPSSSTHSGMSKISNRSNNLGSNESHNLKGKIRMKKKKDYHNSQKTELSFFNCNEMNKRHKRKSTIFVKGTENSGIENGEENATENKVKNDTYIHHNITEKNKKNNIVRNKNNNGEHEENSRKAYSTYLNPLKDKIRILKNSSIIRNSNASSDRSNKNFCLPNDSKCVRRSSLISVKKLAPDGAEQICASVKNENEHKNEMENEHKNETENEPKNEMENYEQNENFSENATKVKSTKSSTGKNGKGVMEKKISKNDININHGYINHASADDQGISISKCKTYASEKSKSTKNSLSIDSSKRTKTEELYIKYNDEFVNTSQSMYSIKNNTSMGEGNLKNRNTHLKYISSTNNIKNNAVNLFRGKYHINQSKGYENDNYENLITHEEITPGNKILTKEKQSMNKYLAQDNSKQKKSQFFFKNENEICNISMCSNEDKLSKKQKHMLNRTSINPNNSNGNAYEEYKMKEIRSEDNIYKPSEYFEHNKTIEDDKSKNRNISNDNIAYKKIYQKESDVFLKDNLNTQCNKKISTLLTSHETKKNDECLNIRANTNASINMNCKNEELYIQSNENIYVHKLQVHPTKYRENGNYKNIKENPSTDDVNSEIFHEIRSSHFFTSKEKEEVRNINKKNVIINPQIADNEGQSEHLTKSSHNKSHTYRTNAHQEEDEREGNLADMAKDHIGIHKNVGSYIPHPIFLSKQMKSTQRSVEKNPFYLISNTKGSNIDSRINFYKTSSNTHNEMEKIYINNSTTPSNIKIERKEYDANNVNPFNRIKQKIFEHAKLNVCSNKNDFEKNAYDMKRTNSIESEEEGKKKKRDPQETYTNRDLCNNDENNQRGIHITGTPFSDMSANINIPFKNHVGLYNNHVITPNDFLKDVQNRNSLISCDKNNLSAHNACNEKKCYREDIGIDNATNIYIINASNEEYNKCVHMYNPFMNTYLDGQSSLNEVLFINKGNWNESHNTINKVSTLRLDNTVSLDFSNIIKNYKEKSDNYLNKKYLQDLDRINFLIQDFTNTYSCNDNLKSIFQLIQYEIEKTKRESQYFYQDQKYLVFTMPLNYVENNYNSCFLVNNKKEPLCEHNLDTYFLQNFETQSKVQYNNCRNNKEQENVRKSCKLVKNFNGMLQSDRVHNNYVSYDSYLKKCSQEMRRTICMNTSSNGSSPSNTTSTLTAAYCNNNNNNNSGNKVSKNSRCIMNQFKKDKQSKYYIQKKRCNNNTNETILSKMNIFIIRHNNHVYKFKLNHNFMLNYSDQLCNKKNGNFFKFHYLFNKIFLKGDYNKRNVLLNDGSIRCTDNIIHSMDNNLGDDTNNVVSLITPNNADENIYNLVQNNGQTNIDELFISDDEVNLIYMYNNHRNEKVYSLEKLDLLKNENPTLCTLNDCTTTGQNN
ncbi:hypothetical protein, conserved [Plasmodium gonderi]|uniref:Uncharacterized protein n=1 Tax=Plasmodium gonderi TaxID=77519 RepID=A0A1Y1JP84_PLAGO|nr:hypothetical protein, conserved [Plasmodium gonderi]GAW82662.1 hypothetical protein, conserved [Plasmodium gonderi]